MLDSFLLKPTTVLLPHISSFLIIQAKEEKDNGQSKEENKEETKNEAPNYPY